MEVSFAKRVITIDGPAGSGKSTIAARLAKVLGFYHLNSGLIFRGIASVVSKMYPGFSSDQIVERIFEWKPILDKFAASFCEREMQVSFDGVLIDYENLSADNVMQLVPVTSALPEVQAIVLQIQQDLARKFSLVADGRNCGSEVFPLANAKIFLTATLDQRSQWVLKRALELGQISTLHEIKNSLERRDLLDKTRKVAPLRQARNAVLVDSTGCSEMDVLKKIICIISPRLS